MALLHSRLCRYSLIFFAFPFHEILLSYYTQTFEVRIMLGCATEKDMRPTVCARRRAGRCGGTANGHRGKRTHDIERGLLIRKRY